MPLFKPRVEKYLNKRNTVRLGAMLKTGSPKEREAAARALEELAEEYRTERNVYGLESVLANVDSRSRVRRNVDRAFKQLVEDLQREGDVNKLEFVLLLNDPGKGGPNSVAVRAARALGEVGGRRALEILGGHRAIDRYIGRAVRESIEMISSGAHLTSEKTRQSTGVQVTQQARKGSRRGKEPKCSVCGITHSEIVERAKGAPGVVVIGLAIGVCPTCLKAFCASHMISANPHDFFDDPKCPDDRTDLDLDWDEPATEKKPWRIGRALKADAVLKAIVERDLGALEDAHDAGQEVAGPLTEALNALDAETRAFAAKGIGNLLLSGAVGALVLSLSDEDATVRANAAGSLGYIANILGEEALVALRDPASVDRVIASMVDTEWSVRSTAFNILGGLRDVRAVPALTAALTDENEIIREFAAEALSEIGGPEAEGALKDHRVAD
jgi:hypothetical protein